MRSQDSGVLDDRLLEAVRRRAEAAASLLTAYEMLATEMTCVAVRERTLSETRRNVLFAKRAVVAAYEAAKRTGDELAVAECRLESLEEDHRLGRVDDNDVSAQVRRVNALAHEEFQEKFGEAWAVMQLEKWQEIEKEHLSLLADAQCGAEAAEAAAERAEADFRASAASEAEVELQFLRSRALR